MSLPLNSSSGNGQLVPAQVYTPWLQSAERRAGIDHDKLMLERPESRRQLLVSWASPPLQLARLGFGIDRRVVDCGFLLGVVADSFSQSALT